MRSQTACPTRSRPTSNVSQRGVSNGVQRPSNARPTPVTTTVLTPVQRPSNDVMSLPPHTPPARIRARMGTRAHARGAPDGAQLGTGIGTSAWSEGAA